MLIIAPRNMHLDIINYYRKDNPFFDIKVVDKSDLIEASSYSCSNEAIIFMMKRYKYSYDEAETYLSFIKTDFVPNNDKLSILKTLQEELIKEGVLYKSDVYRLLYEHKSATVIGYNKDDIELKHLSNLLDMKLDYFSYPNELQVKSFNKFARLEDEVYFVLNEIAHDIDLGTNINDIYIFNRNEEYVYYLKIFASLFGFNINFSNDYSFNKTGVYSEFKKLYEESHDLDDTLEKLKDICKEDDIYSQFVDVINKNRIDGLEYEIQSIYLDKKLSSSYVENNRYVSAVNIISEPTLLKNKKVYVLGFSQGQFPKSQKDDSYLDDNELVYLSKLTSKLKTRFDQENILNFFKLDNEYVLSFSEKSLGSGRMFISPIAEFVDVKINVNPFMNYFYSREALKFIACNLKDLNVIYKQTSPLFLATKELVDKEHNSYDNSFNGAKVKTKDSFLKLSTSRLDDFYNCPFKYYLANILKIDPFEATNESIFGNIVHTLLEKALLDDTYDVSENYDKLVNESNVSDDTKVLWSLALKDQIIDMVTYVKRHNKYMKNAKIELEKNIDVYLDKNTLLTGRIDKLITLDNKYLVMIDYKTGTSGNFEERFLKDGLSTQLPTYALLAKESKYKDLTVSGLYINHVFSKDEVELKEKKLIPDYLRLSGRTLSDYNAFFALDSTIADGSSSFVTGIVSKNDVICAPHSKDSVVSKDKIKEYIDIAKDKYKEAANLIRTNQFIINPVDKGGERNRACTYCSYKDICYVREKQIKHLVSEKEEEDSENEQD